MPVGRRDRSLGRWQAYVGLLIEAGLALVLVLLFNLGRIASLGSAVALLIFSLVTIAHFRVRHVTGGNLAMLVVALLSTLVTLAVFCTTTLAEEPVTIVALLFMRCPSYSTCCGSGPATAGGAGDGTTEQPRTLRENRHARRVPVLPSWWRPPPSATALDRSGGRDMAFVVLLCATFLTALGIWWGTRRRRETAAWNRELDAAFHVGERPEILRRPVL